MRSRLKEEWVEVATDLVERPGNVDPAVPQGCELLERSGGLEMGS